MAETKVCVPGEGLQTEAVRERRAVSQMTVPKKGDAN